MIEAHRYDETTGEYMGTRRIARRRRSRRNRHELHIVGPYTLVRPEPVERERRKARWRADIRGWEEIADYRGVALWSRTTGERVRLKLGEELEGDYTADLKVTTPRRERAERENLPIRAELDQ